jgi:Acetyltransferase (GNAT) family
VVAAEVKLLAPDDARDGVLIAELVRIINDAYAVGEAGLWREGTARATVPEIAAAVRGDGMLAATVAGRLVGCAYVRPVGAGTADLGFISVAPERWGSGVGRELGALGGGADAVARRDDDAARAARPEGSGSSGEGPPSPLVRPARLPGGPNGAGRAGGGAPRAPPRRAVRVPDLPQAAGRGAGPRAQLENSAA